MLKSGEKNYWLPVKLNMENDLKNLQQEVLRLTQRLIGLENRLSGYDAVFNNHNQRLDAQGSDLNRLDNKLDNKIEVLEEARAKQRELNAQFALKTKPEAKIVPNSIVDKRWLAKLLKR